MKLDHIDSLGGEREQRKRLKVLFQTLTGEKSMKEASEELGLSPSRIHELRRQALEGALAGIAPRPPGRRPVSTDPEEVEVRVKELEEELQEMELDLRISRARTELAMAMPNLFQDFRGPLQEAVEKGGAESTPTTRKKVKGRQRLRKKKR